MKKTILPILILITASQPLLAYDLEHYPEAKNQGETTYVAPYNPTARPVSSNDNDGIGLGGALLTGLGVTALVGLSALSILSGDSCRRRY